MRSRLLIRELVEYQFSKEFRLVEIWLGGPDRIPAQEMGMGCEVSAFIEIAPDTDRKIRRIDPYGLERNQHHNRPSEDFTVDFQRFPLKGAISDYPPDNPWVKGNPILATGTVRGE